MLTKEAPGMLHYWFDNFDGPTSDSGHSGGGGRPSIGSEPPPTRLRDGINCGLDVVTNRGLDEIRDRREVFDRGVEGVDYGLDVVGATPNLNRRRR